MGCLSVYSYIKPQHGKVSHQPQHRCLSVYSYIKPQLVASSTSPATCCLSVYSYIKPQRCSVCVLILGVVYLSIPTSNHNHQRAFLHVGNVVYLSIPTSNHNTEDYHVKPPVVVYLSIPTSNHNTCPSQCPCVMLFICLFLHQTTTVVSLGRTARVLFICLFLHQTTTIEDIIRPLSSCLSVYSYIKPQHR